MVKSQKTDHIEKNKSNKITARYKMNEIDKYTHTSQLN